MPARGIRGEHLPHESPVRKDEIKAILLLHKKIDRLVNGSSLCKASCYLQVDTFIRQREVERLTSSSGAMMARDPFLRWIPGVRHYLFVNVTCDWTPF